MFPLSFTDTIHLKWMIVFVTLDFRFAVFDIVLFCLLSLRIWRCYNQVIIIIDISVFFIK